MHTREELNREIRMQVKEVGSQKALAIRWGISQQYLTDVLKGRRKPGLKILRMLGYEPVIVYKKIYHTNGVN